MPNRAPHRKEPVGYSLFVTQDIATSNFSRFKRCPFSDIACLELNSFVILRLCKLSTAGLLILTMFDHYLSSVI